MELKPALFVHITSFHAVSKLRFAPVKWCSITLEDSLLELVVLGGRALKAKLRHCGTVPWDWRGCAEWQLPWMRGRLLAVQSSMQLPGAGDRDTRKITSHYPTGVTQYVEAIPGSAVARGACFPPCSQPAYVGVGMVGNCGNSSCPLFAFCVFAMSVAGSCRKGKQTPHRVGWVPPAGLPVLPSTVLAAFSKASLCGSDPSCTSQEQGQCVACCRCCIPREQLEWPWAVAAGAPSGCVLSLPSAAHQQYPSVSSPGVPYLLVVVAKSPEMCEPYQRVLEVSVTGRKKINKNRTPVSRTSSVASFKNTSSDKLRKKPLSRRLFPNAECQEVFLFTFLET